MARSVSLPGLDSEQISNAQLIYNIGTQLGASSRDIAIAIMTSMDESSLHNLPAGDRDSAGLFQQRPSQGWGTYDQVTDPTYATTTFYHHLLSVKNRDQLTPWMAAQTVQVSGYPDGSNYEAYWNGPANGFQESAPQIFEAVSSGKPIKGGGPVNGGNNANVPPPPWTGTDPAKLIAALHKDPTLRPKLIQWLSDQNINPEGSNKSYATEGDDALAKQYIGVYLITRSHSKIVSPNWLDLIPGIGGALSWLTTASNWKRIGLFVLGAIILFFAVDRMFK